MSPKAKLMVADARFPDTFSAFAVEAVGALPGERQSRRAYERAQDSAQCAVNDDGQLQFSGMSFSTLTHTRTARMWVHALNIVAVQCDTRQP